MAPLTFNFYPMHRLKTRHFGLTLALLASLNFLSVQCAAQSAEPTTTLFVVEIPSLEPYAYADLIKGLDSEVVTMHLACIPTGLIVFDAKGDVPAALAHIQAVLHDATSLSGVSQRTDLDLNSFDQLCRAARGGGQ